jgi:hypothetical protein
MAFSLTKNCLFLALAISPQYEKTIASLKQELEQLRTQYEVLDVPQK